MAGGLNININIDGDGDPLSPPRLVNVQKEGRLGSGSNGGDGNHRSFSTPTKMKMDSTTAAAGTPATQSSVSSRSTPMSSNNTISSASSSRIDHSSTASGGNWNSKTMKVTVTVLSLHGIVAKNVSKNSTKRSKSKNSKANIDTTATIVASFSQNMNDKMFLTHVPSLPVSLSGGQDIESGSKAGSGENTNIQPVVHWPASMDAEAGDALSTLQFKRQFVQEEGSGGNTTRSGNKIYTSSCDEHSRASTSRASKSSTVSPSSVKSCKSTASPPSLTPKTRFVPQTCPINLSISRNGKMASLGKVNLIINGEENGETSLTVPITSSIQHSKSNTVNPVKQVKKIRNIGKGKESSDKTFTETMIKIKNDSYQFGLEENATLRVLVNVTDPQSTAPITLNEETQADEDEASQYSMEGLSIEQSASNDSSLEHDDYQDNYILKENEIRILRQQLMQSEHTNQLLEMELSNLQNENVESEHMVRAMHDENSELRSELESSTIKVESLQKELEVVKNENEMLPIFEERINELLGELKKRDLEVDCLKEELGDVTGQYKELLLTQRGENGSASSLSALLLGRKLSGNDKDGDEALAATKGSSLVFVQKAGMVDEGSQSTPIEVGDNNEAKDTFISPDTAADATSDWPWEIAASLEETENQNAKNDSALSNNVEDISAPQKPGWRVGKRLGKSLLSVEERMRERQALFREQQVRLAEEEQKEAERQRQNAELEEKQRLMEQNLAPRRDEDADSATMGDDGLVTQAQVSEEKNGENTEEVASKERGEKAADVSVRAAALDLTVSPKEQQEEGDLPEDNRTANESASMDMTLKKQNERRGWGRRWRAEKKAEVSSPTEASIGSNSSHSETVVSKEESSPGIPSLEAAPVIDVDISVGDNNSSSSNKKARGWRLGASLKSVEERMRERQALFREQQLREIEKQRLAAELEKQNAEPGLGEVLMSRISSRSVHDDGKAGSEKNLEDIIEEGVTEECTDEQNIVVEETAKAVEASTSQCEGSSEDNEVVVDPSTGTITNDALEPILPRRESNQLQLLESVESLEKEFCSKFPSTHDTVCGSSRGNNSPSEESDVVEEKKTEVGAFETANENSSQN